jgi:hypothetical protein
MAVLMEEEEVVLEAIGVEFVEVAVVSIASPPPSSSSSLIVQ